MIPMELVYLAIAVGLGALAYRYVTGRGGVELRRADYAGLPERGRTNLRDREVRWSAADDGSFVAGWQLEDGHIVAMSVAFGTDEEEPDLGRLDISIDRRTLARDVGWTEKIRDRTLRADAEAALQALAREARRARSDAVRVATAKPVGDDRGATQRDETRE